MRFFVLLLALTISGCETADIKYPDVRIINNEAVTWYSFDEFKDRYPNWTLSRIRLSANSFQLFGQVRTASGNRLIILEAPRDEIAFDWRTTIVPADGAYALGGTSVDGSILIRSKEQIILSSNSKYWETIRLPISFSKTTISDASHESRAEFSLTMAAAGGCCEPPTRYQPKQVFIAKTESGGASWIYENLNDLCRDRVHIASSDPWTVVGCRGVDRSVLHKIYRSGEDRTWHLIGETALLGFEPYELHILSRGTVFYFDKITAQGKDVIILRGADPSNGTNISFDCECNPQKLFMRDDGLGILVGFRGPPLTFIYYVTDDGGHSWSQLDAVDNVSPHDLTIDESGKIYRLARANAAKSKAISEDKYLLEVYVTTGWETLHTFSHN